MFARPVERQQQKAPKPAGKKPVQDQPSPKVAAAYHSDKNEQRHAAKQQPKKQRSQKQAQPQKAEQHQAASPRRTERKPRTSQEREAALIDLVEKQ